MDDYKIGEKGKFKVIALHKEDAYYPDKKQEIGRIYKGKITRSFGDGFYTFYIFENGNYATLFYKAKLKKINSHKELLKKAKIIRRLGNKLL